MTNTHSAMEWVFFFSGRSAVEFVDRLAGGLGYLSGGVLERASDLIGDAFVGEIRVSGSAAEALFHLADELSASAANSRFRTPLRRAASGIFKSIATGGVLRTRSFADNVSHYAKTKSCQ